MTDARSFDDIVDAAITELRGGADIASILARHPQHAPVLRPLLETAALAAATTAEPPSERLAANFAVLQASLTEARRSYAPAPVKHVLWSPRAFAASASAAVMRTLSDVDKRVQWAPRRLAFASLSLPVFAVAALVAGAGGAAAAALIADEPAFVRILANAVTPDWAVHIGPDDQADNDGPPPASAVETPASTAPGAADPATVSTPRIGASATAAAARQATRTATTAENNESNSATPGIKKQKEETPGNGQEKNATPVPDTDVAPPPSATPPGKSGDAPAHSTTTPEATRTPKPTRTPNGNTGGGNGPPTTSTPDADDDDPGNSPNGNGGGSDNGNGNNNP